MTRPRTRPPGSKPSPIYFSPYQRENLNAIGETNPTGRVNFQALVSKAVDNFIAEQLATPGVRERVAKYLVEHPKVVPLRDVSRSKEPKG